MKPQLGDTLFNRYTLVTLLRDVPYLQAWKATDRVLARECQLFIVTDPAAIESVSSMATAVGRKAGVNPVLQFRKAGQAAMLVTQIEQGLSLHEYLLGKASGTFSFEAIRTVIGEAAGIASGLQEPRLSVDTIRISTSGVELADAPLASLLVDTTRPKTGEAAKEEEQLPVEQLAIRQLAFVMAALVMRAPALSIDQVDLHAMPDDLPPEFKVIMARGLELPDEAGNASEPMLTLGELTALLGEWTPLGKLSGHDLAVPGESGNGSIAMAALVEADSKFKPVSLPDDVVTREKLRNLTIDHAPTEAEAAEHADRVVARQNREAFESLPADPVIDVNEPRSLWHLAAGATGGPLGSGTPTGDIPLPERRSQRQQPTVAIPRAAIGSDLDATIPGDASSDLFHEFSFQTYPSPAPMPNTFGPGEETTRIPIMTENQPTMALDMSAIRSELPARPEGASAHGATASGASGAVAPGASGAAPSFPPHAMDDSTIVTGDAERTSRTGNVESYVMSPVGQLPPSFVPRPAQSVEESSEPDDNLSDHRLFGNVRITVAVITVAVVLIAAALTVALVTFHNNSNSGNKGDDANQWPEQNLNDVPFGDSGSQKKTSTNAHGAAADDIVLVDVTAAYYRR
ncbi:hypothetical protein JS531_07525 [Bifidobacterium sp. CP2]|uniref:hypothetical protein n=1 Tax=Bifidobacterium sp. CP2 TaxID=2809025 RepID=UPI001BDC2D4D|nr:hypothetical protein [Bifidobacterium sp. CP2]MBT1181804.1 hypothetical protein [Bifidobacterium sp. CP2]